MANILLIDDDPVLVKLYTTRLKVDKHVVQSSNNGEDGLKVLTQFKPDVIVLDLMMPKMNGFKFIDAIKANPNTKQIPIIVFSSLANPTQKAQLKQKGVTEVLNKVEITPTQLVQTINQIITPK